MNAQLCSGNCLQCHCRNTQIIYDGGQATLVLNKMAGYLSRVQVEDKNLGIIQVNESKIDPEIKMNDNLSLVRCPPC